MIKFMGQYGRPNLALAGILVKNKVLIVVKAIMTAHHEKVPKVANTELQEAWHKAIKCVFVCSKL